MKKHTKTLLIPLLLLAIMLAGMSSYCWAENAIVLTFRPDLLSENKHTLKPVTPGRDPFSWPANAPENLIYQEQEAAAQAKQINAAFGSIRLGAILWSAQSPRAIINDEVVGEKEITMGVFVDKITKNSVILKKDNMIHELTFKRKVIDFN